MVLSPCQSSAVLAAALTADPLNYNILYLQLKKKKKIGQLLTKYDKNVSIQTGQGLYRLIQRVTPGRRRKY